MTKRDAEAIFREYHLPAIRERESEYGGGPDYIMRCEEWNNFTDSLCKDRQITEDQYRDWDHPDFCSSEAEKRANGLRPIQDIMES